MHAVTRAASEGLGVVEARSWIWPRVDASFQAMAAVNRSNGSRLTSSSGGLMFSYDFQKLLFSSDVASVAAANRDLWKQKAQLALNAAIGRMEDLLIELCGLRAAVPLQERRLTELQRLTVAAEALDQLGALAPGMLIEWRHRQQVAVRERRESARRLENVRQLLRTGLGLAGDAEPEVGGVDRLLTVPPLPESAPGEGDAARWLPAVWEAHPAARIAENELFVAEMAIVEARRERMPRLTGSIGLGDLDTRVRETNVDARSMVELGISVPLFDAGTISRHIKKAGLDRDLARRNLSIQVSSLAGEIQTAAAHLRAVQAQAEGWRTETEELHRLADLADRGAALGQGDPLLPHMLRVYQAEAELGVREAAMDLAKAWRAYQTALGQEAVPGLSAEILPGLIRDTEQPKKSR